MADVYTRIGYIKGATGATGATGAKGDTGDAATIQVGSVTTVPYGQTANVVNSGTEQAAVFDFTIPQGRPGQQTTEMDDLTLNSITTSSASFPIPAIGETGKVLWGKVVKWFSDMSALVATKLNAANVVNNLTTTASGYALDARQGRELAARGTVTAGTFSSITVPRGETTTLGTVSVPSAGSKYLVLTHMTIGTSISEPYNHVLGSRTVRSTGMNGGGSINFLIASAGENHALRMWYSSSNTAASLTASAYYCCIRLQ